MTESPAASGSTAAGTGDPSVQEDLRATALLDEVQRRQNVAEARRLTQQARDRQNENDLSTARDLYLQALALDPTNAQAQQGARRGVAAARREHRQRDGPDPPAPRDRAARR
jgi:hypothetical protein